MVQKELFLKRSGAGQDTIYTQSWSPDSPSEASPQILITHGVCEHSGCYQWLASQLAEQGYSVISWDLPGHGQSYGQRGYVSGFDEFLITLNQVATDNPLIDPKRPLHFFGHSLGGLITFCYGMRFEAPESSLFCLSSPAFGVAIEVPFIKDMAARALNKWAPKITIPHEINFEELSRDQEVLSTYGKDPLRHKKFSAPLYLGILNQMEWAQFHASRWKRPLLIQAAGTDSITDVHATKNLFKKIGTDGKQIKIYPQSYHEIFNDLNRQDVLEDLVEYLKGQHQ